MAKLIIESVVMHLTETGRILTGALFSYAKMKQWTRFPPVISFSFNFLAKMLII